MDQKLVPVESDGSAACRDLGAEIGDDLLELLDCGCGVSGVGEVSGEVVEGAGEGGEEGGGVLLGEGASDAYGFVGGFE
ncbi:hypothetical protein, partial [Streptomyces sp. SID2563]|uniref:hypothetical protein n=1 Tax=Streptomyces sp. SID2563 TaxID=2690255 RepID=UPI001F28C376